jgi:recombination protein RecT
MADKPTGQELVKQKKEALDFLSSRQLADQVAKVLPKHVTAERMLRIALTSVMRKPELMAAATHPAGKASLLNAIMLCSQAGLEPDGRLAHLIPFYNSKAGCYEVQVIYDFKGLITLGLRNGFQSIYADYACEGDEFDAYVENGTKKLLHRVNWRAKDRGKPFLFYAVTMRDGVLDYEIMSWDETEAIRQRSKAKDKGPWVTDDLEMRKKGCIRRMSKRWDLLPELRDVFNAEDDLPPAIDVGPPTMTRPLFPETKPPAQVENGHAENGTTPVEPPPVAPPVTEAEGPQPDAPEKDPEFGPQPEAERVKPPVKKAPAQPGPLSIIRQNCQKDGIEEGKLLDFLSQIGATDGSFSDLEELILGNEKLTKIVTRDWPSMVQRIKGKAAA